jgi:hypothetical protein
MLKIREESTSRISDIQGVTKMSSFLVALTNSALVYETKCGRWEGGALWGLSQSVHLSHEDQINIGDLTPYF